MPPVSVFFNLNGKINPSLFYQIMTAVLLREVMKQKLRIPMGAPAFKYKEEFKRKK